jgi:hypothetical protein
MSWTVSWETGGERGIVKAHAFPENIFRGK